jgi:hypothetical protein
VLGCLCITVCVEVRADVEGDERWNASCSRTAPHADVSFLQRYEDTFIAVTELVMG